MKARFVVGVICLALGFLLGRVFPFAGSSLPKSAATPRLDPARAVTTSTAPRDTVAEREGQDPAAAAVHRERMDALRWIAASGVPMQMRTFSGSELNPMLVRLLGLNASECARLEKAYAQARGEIDARRAAQAKSTRSADGTRLVVEAPGLDPTASGQIYDRFAGEFKATLGPDRTAMAEQISGTEGFESALEGFGLQPIRYELELRPVVNSDGVALYEYKRHHLNASGASLAAPSGRFSLAQIRKRDPLLEPFLPSSPSP